jgi:hypothetical protein
MNMPKRASRHHCSRARCGGAEAEAGAASAPSAVSPNKLGSRTVARQVKGQVEVFMQLGFIHGDVFDNEESRKDQPTQPFFVRVFRRRTPAPVLLHVAGTSLR